MSDGLTRDGWFPKGQEYCKEEEEGEEEEWRGVSSKVRLVEGYYILDMWDLQELWVVGAYVVGKGGCAG